MRNGINVQYWHGYEVGWKQLTSSQRSTLVANSFATSSGRILSIPARNAILGRGRAGGNMRISGVMALGPEIQSLGQHMIDRGQFHIPLIHDLILGGGWNTNQDGSKMFEWGPSLGN